MQGEEKKQPIGGILASKAGRSFYFTAEVSEDSHWTVVVDPIEIGDRAVADFRHLCEAVSRATTFDSKRQCLVIPGYDAFLESQLLGYPKGRRLIGKVGCILPDSEGIDILAFLDILQENLPDIEMDQGNDRFTKEVKTLSQQRPVVKVSVEISSEQCPASPLLLKRAKKLYEAKNKDKTYKEEWEDEGIWFYQLRIE